MSEYLSNNSNSFNVSNNITFAADNRSEILAWLSPLEPRIRHRDIQARRVDNVGDWLFQTNEFRSWCDGNGEGGSDNATLFCYGDPGVGKTYISSLVVDQLCDQAKGQKTVIVCFYIDFASRGEQTAINIMGSLLKQLVSGLDTIPGEVIDAFQAQKKAIGGRVLRLAEIVKLFQIITSSQRTIICVDALDECIPEHCLVLLDSLRQILRVSPGTRLFLAGRPHIRSEIERKHGAVTVVSISPRRDDIVNFIRERLDKDINPDAMSDDLEADILQRIPEAVSEIFLLVSLNTEAILRETTVYRRRQRLGAITDGLRLGDAYGATLERIKAQGGERSRLGMAALMWICYVERPLQVDELCHALAVEIRDSNLNAENVPSIGTLLGCCQGLFTVDKKGSTVRLVHFTLQEYLCTHQALFNRAHSTIAETCLTYLNSQQVKDLSANPSVCLQDTPFLKYSSRYWGTHARVELSNCAHSLAMDLFNECERHISAKVFLRQVWSWGPVKYDSGSVFSGLHYASFFGISELAAALIEVGGYDINLRDCVGFTPLIWAAMHGHLDVVRLLLGRKYIHPDKPDNDNRTPLSWAARNGHVGVVELLLGQEGVDPGKQDCHGQAPLSEAARNGQEGVVKILLERRDVDPDKPGDNGQTPLSGAARYGHEGVARLLLAQNGVDPDKPDDYSQTPLLWAAENGHEGVVRLLLGREDVDPDRPDNNSQTPLSWAARNGHCDVVKILLERRDVDPDKPDKGGQAPLSGAARYGHEGVVKLLLERKDVDPNREDKAFGRTALSWAAGNGHGGVVELLLGREGIDSGGRDKLFARTAFTWAAGGGHEGVARLFPVDPSEQLETHEAGHSEEPYEPLHVPELKAEGLRNNPQRSQETNANSGIRLERMRTIMPTVKKKSLTATAVFKNMFSRFRAVGDQVSGEDSESYISNLFSSSEYSSCRGTVGSSSNESANGSRSRTSGSSSNASIRGFYSRASSSFSNMRTNRPPSRTAGPYIFLSGNGRQPPAHATSTHTVDLDPVRASSSFSNMRTNRPPSRTEGSYIFLSGNGRQPPAHATSTHTVDLDPVRASSSFSNMRTNRPPSRTAGPYIFLSGNGRQPPAHATSTHAVNIDSVLPPHFPARQVLSPRRPKPGPVFKCYTCKTIFGDNIALDMHYKLTECHTEYWRDSAWQEQ